jgi:hypothetical protein
MTGRKLMAALMVTAAALIPAACNDDPSGVDPGDVFVVEVIDQHFRVRATDATTVAALEAMRATGANRIVMGELVRGDGGFNSPWSWHLDPATVQVADQAIELCDGRPAMVEDDLDYWIDTVGQYCPWSAEVVDVR